jgi:site-specific recombinase XerD
LLGHSSLKTTEIYTHVGVQGMNKIKNPLDLMSV